MLDWYASHETEIRDTLHGILYFNGFLFASAFMYLLYDIGLWNLGLRRHGAIVRKEAPVGQFPDGYFTMLAVQLLPLTVAGFARHDEFVIATRVATLVTVLIVYGISASKDGTFDTTPEPDTPIEVGDVLIGVGTADELRRLEDLFAPREALAG